jgi:hypothetical protein
VASIGVPSKRDGTYPCLISYGQGPTSNDSEPRALHCFALSQGQCVSPWVAGPFGVYQTALVCFAAGEGRLPTPTTETGVQFPSQGGCEYEPLQIFGIEACSGTR